ncbi:MAG: ATP synthase F1 subunit delta [Pirellulaceae bacterium]|jgi:F-type H+-transporting ATPase subunit delta|nr:ATP synthase F1 subunit delta [Pirellulaceae bacterium]
MAEANASTPLDAARERVGAVYAQALVGAAEAQRVTPQLLEEFDALVDDLLGRLPQFGRLLASPRIRLEEKHRLLELAFATRMSPLLLNFLKVLARHGRLDALRQIRTAAHQRYDALSGRVEVSVQSATPLGSVERGQIEQRVSVALGRPVRVRYAVAPQLLGGLLVRVGDTVFDGSLDNRLERMRLESVRRATELIRGALPEYLMSQTETT